MVRLVFAVFALSLVAGSAGAQTVRSACLKSEKGRGQSQLCGCIQNVADRTLTKSDQRRVAAFFTDPDRAQRVRQSGNKSDEKFWDRYQVFGSTAEAFCRR
jgi:hypothetical protein